MLSCFVAVVAVAALDAAGVKVKTDYDRSADFAALRSYAWLPAPPYRTQVSPDVQDRFLARETLDAPIRAAVDRVFAAKGLKPAPEGSPADCYVVYYAAFGTQIAASILGEYYAYITGWGGPLSPMPTQSLQVIEEGTVVVDVLNREKKVAIWRGTATGTVDRDQTDQQRLRRINEAVDKMFKKFPPGK
jgi:hypothetical protein